MDLIISVVLLVLLLMANAALAAFEISLIKLRFSHFNPDLLDRLRADKGMARMLDQGDTVVRVARLGMTMCMLGYAVVAMKLVGVLIHHLVGTALPGLVVALIAFLVAICVHYVIGELVPRGIGLQHAVRVFKLTSWVVRVFQILTWPLIRPLTRVARGVLRLLGTEPQLDLESLDLEAQIEMLGKEAPELSVVGQRLLKNAVQMRTLAVSDILLPRNKVNIFDLQADNRTNFELAKKTGHTRFPLCDGDLDHTIGLIHIKDIFRHPGDPLALDLRKVRRNIMRLQLEEPLEDALQKLLRYKMHMALVEDDFGGAVGVVTLEQILEQLVGDIQDEFDFEEAHIREVEENIYLVQGLTPIHEIDDAFDLEIENEEVSTFGGLITAELGRFPSEGEEVTIDRLHIRMEQVDERRVILARVELLPPPVEEEES